MDLSGFAKRRSYFGRTVWSPLALFVDAPGFAELRRFVAEQLEPALSRYDLGFDTVEGACRDALAVVARDFEVNSRDGRQGPHAARRLRLAEAQAERSLATFRLSEHTDTFLLDRARTICSQIAGPIRRLYQNLNANENEQERKIALLDVGCGDGLVPHLLLNDGKFSEVGSLIDRDRLLLTDVHDYRDEIQVKGIYDFVELDPNYERFPFYSDSTELKSEETKKALDALKAVELNGRIVDLADRKFDCILLLTVLHHSECPRSVFRACWEVANPAAYLIVIESVVDVLEKTIREKRRIRDNTSVLDDPSQATKVQRFLHLPPRDQLIYGCFIDWFYNRILHEDVYVPFNFTSPREWNSFFALFDGIRVVETHVEGFDQESVPEFHSLHVLERH